MKVKIKSGYVYILENEAMPYLIKIGYTSRSPEERSRELSRPTGVPIDFVVKYSIFTHNIEILEKSVHSLLHEFRVNKSKEFFKYDLDAAIEIVRNFADKLRQEIAQHVNDTNELFEEYESIELLRELKKMYPNQIKDEIGSVRIYQTAFRCYLEITTNKFIVKYEDSEIPLVDQYIYRKDLGFLTAEMYSPIPVFNPANSILKNAKIFLDEFDYDEKQMYGSEIFK